MTIRRIKTLLAILALLLGVAHILFGVWAFKNLTLDSFWFMSFGAAMIICALANFKADRTWILRLQNAIMLTFLGLLLSLIQQPQILFGAFIFSALTLISFMSRSAALQSHS